MQGGDVFAQHRAYVLWNALGLFALGGLRALWIHHLKRSLEQHFDRSCLVFRVLTLLRGVHWGGLLAICMTTSSQADTRHFMLPFSVALVMSGTMMMAIDKVLGLAYPLITVGPPVITLLALRDPTATVYAISVGCLALYAWAMSRLFRNDYFRGERARFLQEDRARELESLSLTDALTQVRNRLFIDRHLPVLWKEARRQRQPLAVALVDLDHFKKVNDTHGHPFGDECLRYAARALREELLRPQDVVARYGGEEFLVLMPNTDEQGALAVTERLRARVSAGAVEMGGRRAMVTCSIGVCSAVPGDRDADEGFQHLMQRADEALYQAKAQGRNRVVAVKVGTA